MPTPLEEVVSQNYKHSVRFLVALAGVIGFMLVAGERAKAFVDDRIESKTRTTELTLANQAKRIERMEAQLDEVRTTVIEIRAETASIKAMLQKQEK
jgi:hypothetical protein